MKIEFYKYEGTGNDFIIIDNRNKKLKTGNPALWEKLCDRHFGIGADGLMLIQNKKGYDFEMIYFNADGNESSMCGNGGRCITHLAKQLGIVEGKSAKFIAIDGEHEAVFVTKDVVKLKMSDVKNIQDHKSYYTLNTGSPHYVTMIKNVMKIPVNIDGKTIRNREPFKKQGGINVNFVQVSSGNIPVLRTYERGVENETLSCGTGTVATALVLAGKGLASAKNYCDIQTMGGMLKVWFTQQKGSFNNIWLEGPATFVFKGEVEI